VVGNIPDGFILSGFQVAGLALGAIPDALENAHLHLMGKHGKQDKDGAQPPPATTPAPEQPTTTSPVSDDEEPEPKEWPQIHL
jgi:hypothetical protein